MFDISNISLPLEVSLCTAPEYARDVFVLGTHAYVTEEDGGLFVIDISDPLNPQAIATCDVQGSARGVFVAGIYAYVASWWGYDDGRLQVFDVSDPSSPQEMGFYDQESHFGDVFVSGTCAYVNASGGMEILDISDPADPVRVSGCYTHGGTSSVFVSGIHAYVTYSWAGLQVVDVSDPADPTDIGFFNAPADARDIIVSDSFAYLTGGRVEVIDISNVSNPQQVGFFNFENRPGLSSYGAFISDSFLYVAGIVALHVISIAAPSNPQEVGVLHGLGFPYGVIVSGTYAYVTEHTDGGLWVIDVSDPSSPQKVAFCDLPARSEHLCVLGSYAYVTYWNHQDDSGGLRIIDISDPTNPQEIGFLDTPEPTRDVAVSNSFAYVIGGGWLRVVDVSDPTNPQEITAFGIRGFGDGIFVSGGHAYVTAGCDGGLQVIDISNPTKPQDAGYHDTPGWAYSVFASGGYTFVADGEAGLQVYQFVGGSQRTITVTCPNGGEDWEIGSTYSITWTSQNAGDNVKLEYSTNNGGTWKSITNSTPNDGSYPWTIPNDPSTQCLVKITSTTYPDISDTSDDNFAIIAPAVDHPPNAPTNLQAVTIDAFEVMLSWVDNSSNEEKFVIVRNGYLLEIVGEDVTTWTDSSCQPDRDYCYKVYAANSAGASATTNEACVHTPHGGQLKYGWVVPDMGTLGDDFTFRVTFYDSAGRQPDVVYLYLNDEPKEMQFQESYELGLRYSCGPTPCPVGLNHYYFVAEVNNDTYRLPAGSGEFVGPWVGLSDELLEAYLAFTDKLRSTANQTIASADLLIDEIRENLAEVGIEAIFLLVPTILKEAGILDKFPRPLADAIVKHTDIDHEFLKMVWVIDTFAAVQAVQMGTETEFKEVVKFLIGGGAVSWLDGGLAALFGFDTDDGERASLLDRIGKNKDAFISFWESPDILGAFLTKSDLERVIDDLDAAREKVEDYREWMVERLTAKYNAILTATGAIDKTSEGATAFAVGGTAVCLILAPFTGGATLAAIPIIVYTTTGAKAATTGLKFGYNIAQAADATTLSAQILSDTVDHVLMHALQTGRIQLALQNGTYERSEGEVELHDPPEEQIATGRTVTFKTDFTNKSPFPVAAKAHFYLTSPDGAIQAILTNTVQVLRDASHTFSVDLYLDLGILGFFGSALGEWKVRCYMEYGPALEEALWSEIKTFEVVDPIVSGFVYVFSGQAVGDLLSPEAIIAAKSQGGDAPLQVVIQVTNHTEFALEDVELLAVLPQSCQGSGRFPRCVVG